MGRTNWNTAPLGVFPTNHNRPSWASMMERQIDRPIPMPSGFVVNSGLKISIDILRGDALATVSNRYHDAAIHDLRLYGQDPRSVLACHRIDGIRDQI